MVRLTHRRRAQLRSRTGRYAEGAHHRKRPRIGGMVFSAAAVLSLVTLGDSPPQKQLDMQDRAAILANLWVDTSGGSCSRSAPPAGYSDAAACGSFNAAWQAASAGDMVRVRPGNYGNQFFNSNSPAMTAPGVTFRAGGAVKIGKLDVGDDPGNFGSGRGRQDVDWLTLVGDFKPYGVTLLRHTSNVTFDGWTWNQGFQARKAIVWLGDTDRTTIRNSDICCTTDDKLMEATVPSPGFGANANITVEHTKIHSLRRTSSGVHNECFLAMATPGLTLRSTHWYGCTVMNLNIGAFGAAAPYAQSNFHWVNNIFEAPTNLTEHDKTGLPFFQGCNAPSTGSKPGWVVEYNVFETPWYQQPGCGDAGLMLRANVGAIGGTCPFGAAFSRNIWKERTCGSTDIHSATILSAANFRNIPGHDWRYPADAFQIDRGDSKVYPPFDAARRARPIKIRVATSKSASAIRLSGEVSPRRPKGRMVVTLSQRQHGAWRRLAVKRPRLSSRSTFSTSFQRARQRVCRATARVVGASNIGRADAGPYEFPPRRRSSVLVAFRC
jgi:hypothetical protein